MFFPVITHLISFTQNKILSVQTYSYIVPSVADIALEPHNPVGVSLYNIFLAGSDSYQARSGICIKIESQFIVVHKVRGPRKATNRKFSLNIIHLISTLCNQMA